MQNFIEDDVKITIREYSTKADKPLTNNKSTIVFFYSYKFIDKIYIC